MENSITVNGVEYVRKGSSGPRYVVVLDRGWVVAGDVEDVGGRIRITRAVHVLRWEGTGFAGMVAAGKSPKVTISPLPEGLDAPADAELFRVPVGDSWGL